MEINLSNYEAWFLDYNEGNLTQAQQAELLLFLEQHPELKSELESFENISLVNTPLPFPEKSSIKKNILDINDATIEELCIRCIENDLSEEEKDAFFSALKNNANYLSLYSAYQKTILSENSASFTDKVFLQQLDVNEMLASKDKSILFISLIEKTLSKEEEHLALNAINRDKNLSAEFKRYQQTVLAKETLVYEHKNKLKKKEKVIVMYPWQRYVTYAAAASLLLFFFIGNPDTANQESVIVKNTKLDVDTVNQDHSTKELLPINKQNQSNFALNNEDEDLNKNTNSTVLPKKKKEVQSNSLPLPQNEMANEYVRPRDSIRPDEIEDIIIPYEVIEEHYALEHKKDSLANLTNESVAQNSATSDKEADYLSPKEFLALKANQKLFNKDKTTFGKEEVLKTTELGISKISGKETAIAAVDEEERSAIHFSLGGFEFSRKKSK